MLRVMLILALRANMQRKMGAEPAVCDQTDVQDPLRASVPCHWHQALTPALLLH